MRSSDTAALFDHLYWVRDRILAAASHPGVPLTSDAHATIRDLRATLVHELDVEWSWRENVRGKQLDEWGTDEELKPDDFPDVASLRDRWTTDEAEMRTWLASLTDADVGRQVRSAFTNDRRPLWQYLMHIVSHAAQQQADAATLLTLAGRSPGDIGYLEYLYDREGRRR